MIEAKKYREDHRESNPGLHLLYVKWACRNLQAIDNCVQVLNRLHQTPLNSIICKMLDERSKLVNEDAAYAEADEILKEIKSVEIDMPEQNLRELEA